MPQVDEDTGHHFNHDKLSNRILAALALGAATGLLLNATIADQAWVQDWIIGGLFHVTGQLFVRGLSMLVVPIVFVSLVAGVSTLGDPARLGRISAMAIGLYLITTGVAVVLALSAALIFQPGAGASPGVTVHHAISAAPPFAEVVIALVPRNPVAAMAKGQMLPVIVFSILLGLAFTFAGSAGKRMTAVFNDLNTAIMKLVDVIMTLAPYGVFALVAALAASTGWQAFAGLIKYVLLVLGVLLLHAGATYPALLSTLTRLSPVMFYRKMRDVAAFAFSTASSNATIPVTLRTVEERLGAANRVSAFTIPLGATINMDGTAIMQGLATGFIAQYYGIELSIAQYAMVVVMVVLASIGTAGVPGVGLIMLAGVLKQVGLPAEGIALILGVDRLLDMSRTVVNVCGDAIVTVIVARATGDLDETVFRDPHAGDEPAPA
jgi:Na+/H+-dicarboxylate symporter